MAKFSKILVYLFFAFGVAMSWAKTADQAASARDRLTQSLDSKGKKKVRLVADETVPLPGFSEIPKSINGKGDGASANGDGAWTSSMGSAADVTNGSASLNGGAGTASGGRVILDDSAKAPDAKDFGKNGKSGSLPPITTSQSGSGAVKGTAKPMSLWWPVCMFVDENVDPNTANESIKGMVDDAAQNCDVSIQVFPVKVSHASWASWALEPDKINEQTRSKCNVPGGLAGSSTAFVSPNGGDWAKTAAKMCGSFTAEKNGPDRHNGQEGRWELSVAGCAELAKGGSQLSDKFKQANAGHGHGTSQAAGAIAASIEVALGQNAGVLSHEALGHSMLGKPNGKVHGHGIGEEGDTQKGGAGEGSPSESWTTQGCGIMKSKAHGLSDWYANFGGSPPMYDSQRQNYYIPNPQAPLYNIQSSAKIFEKQNSVPPPGIVIARKPQPPGILPTLARTSPPSQQTPDFFEKSKIGKSPPEDAPPQKHKKGEAVASANIASVRASTKLSAIPNPQASEPRAGVQTPVSPPSAGETRKGNKIEWAENAPEADPAAFAGKSKSTNSASTIADTLTASVYESPSAPASAGNKGRGSITYDESSTDYAPGAGGQNAGSQNLNTGSKVNGNAVAVGGGGGSFGSNGGSTIGSMMKKPSGFSNDTFNLGEEEDPEADTLGGKRRPKKPGESISGRNPASAQRGGRSAKPIYGDTDI